MSLNNILNRLSKISGHEINIPKPEECQRIREEAKAKAEAEQYDRFARQQKEHAFKQAVGGSSIPVRYQSATLENYEVYDKAQNCALQFAKEYMQGFTGSVPPSSFVFSGGTGTGKNHLAAALCMAIINAGGSAKLVTVNELDQHRRAACYGQQATMTEIQFMRQVAKIDLLVLDEVGLTTNSASQRVFIDQLINDRSNLGIPTGVITNFNTEELSKELGPRIMNRLQEGGGHWISFTWESYRTRGNDQ